MPVRCLSREKNIVSTKSFTDHIHSAKSLALIVVYVVRGFKFIENRPFIVSSI